MRRHPHHKLVVFIENGRAKCRQRFHQFLLGSHNRIHTARPLQMHWPHNSQDANLRLGQIAKPRNLTGGVHAHFQHRPLVVALQFQQSQGQADFIVLITGRF